MKIYLFLLFFMLSFRSQKMSGSKFRASSAKSDRSQLESGLVIQGTWSLRLYERQ
jgi:hypothetical protein